MTGGPVTLRDAVPADAPAIMGMVRALAEHEGMLDQVGVTDNGLAQALGGKPPLAHALLVEAGGETVGVCVYSFLYSTFTGRGAYIEDVYIAPAHRGRGLGTRMFATVARRALALGAASMEWSVVTKNRRALDFYRGLGASAMDEWTGHRIKGAAFAALARQGGEDGTYG